MMSYRNISKTSDSVQDRLFYLVFGPLGINSLLANSGVVRRLRRIGQPFDSQHK